uniref:Uncharacterized protein n=1 Tax=Anguilla anguilla TaxID=7936 RepID=A0A0E9X9Z2_ANGAN
MRHLRTPGTLASTQVHHVRAVHRHLPLSQSLNSMTRFSHSPPLGQYH